MTESQAKQIISAFDELWELAEQIAIKLSKLDSKYRLWKGVEKISFEEDNVCVTVDASYSDCTDYEYFEFPIRYLWTPESEIEAEVRAEREKWEQIDKIAADARAKQEEEQQRKIYLALKQKFESQ